MEPRQRRHTINRPTSIQEQLPEAHDEEQTFERISGILSTLLQEANNAVNAVECKQTPRWMQKKDDGDMMIQSLQSISKQISPVGLPRNANNLDQQHSNECGHDSSSSSSSSSTTTSPSSPELSPSSQSSSSSTTSLDSTTTTTTLLWRKGSATIKDITHPTMNSSSAQYRGALLRGSLVESYKRLDQSMAMVDSLSRDLASSDEQDADEDQHHNDDDQETSIFVNGKSPRPFHHESNNNNINNNTTTVDLRLSAFLVAPFLHFPQALISWVFDSLSNRDSSTHLTGMLAWCFFFAFANIMVDQAAAGLPSQRIGRCSRNVPVPGSYHNKGHRVSPTEGVSSTSSLFRRRSARRTVVIPRRSSIYRKYYSCTTRRVSPTIMHHAKTITPCRRIINNNNSSSIRMQHPSHHRPHSLAITRSHTQPPLDITLSPPLVSSPLTTTLSSILPSSSSSSSSIITRRNSF